MCSRNVTYDTGQQVGRDGWDDPDPEPPDERIARTARHFGKSLRIAQDPAHTVAELHAEGRQPYVPRAALEELQPQRRFKLLDLRGKRGLGDCTGCGGASEMAVAGDRLEIAELLEGEIDHKKNLSHS